MRTLVFVLTSDERYHRREIQRLRSKRGIAVRVVTRSTAVEEVIQDLDAFGQEEAKFTLLPGERLGDWYELISELWRAHERPARWCGY